jgi:hypothetical protein
MVALDMFDNKDAKNYTHVDDKYCSPHNVECIRQNVVIETNHSQQQLSVLTGQLQQQVDVPTRSVTQEIVVPDKNATRVVNVPSKLIEQELHIPGRAVYHEMSVPQRVINQRIVVPSRTLRQAGTMKAETYTNAIVMKEESMYEHMQLDSLNFDDSQCVRTHIKMRQVDLRDQQNRGKLNYKFDQPDIWCDQQAGRDTIKPSMKVNQTHASPMWSKDVCAKAKPLKQQIGIAKADATFKAKVSNVQVEQEVVIGQRNVEQITVIPQKEIEKDFNVPSKMVPQQMTIPDHIMLQTATLPDKSIQQTVKVEQPDFRQTLSVAGNTTMYKACINGNTENNQAQLRQHLLHGEDCILDQSSESSSSIEKEQVTVTMEVQTHRGRDNKKTVSTRTISKTGGSGLTEAQLQAALANNMQSTQKVKSRKSDSGSLKSSSSKKSGVLGKMGSKVKNFGNTIEEKLFGDSSSSSSDSDSSSSSD